MFRPPATAFLCFVLSGKLAASCVPVLCFPAWPPARPWPLARGRHKSVSLAAVGNRIENIRWSVCMAGGVVRVSRRAGMRIGLCR